MSMSHIYQPVMIKTMLLNHGSADKNTIATELLKFDSAQIKYYETRVSQMVGKVLQNKNITSYDGASYQFIEDISQYSDGEVEELIQLCDEAVEEYLHKRGDKLYQHRDHLLREVSGSVRYQVLKDAEGLCELCGISSKLAPIDVDHIIPKSKGGSDDISNLQALCGKCNRNKGNRDNKSFKTRLDFNHKDSECVFCNLPSSRIVSSNELAIAFRDQYPVTNGHTLVIPKRHISDYFELTKPELNAIKFLIDEQRKQLTSEDSSITGFNVGVNIGEDAGQTIFHSHTHLIPRRKNDTSNPKGGVRGVIPNKQQY